MRNTAWKGGFLQYSFRKISLFFWQNSMVQRVSMINSNKTQLNSDYDFSMLRKWLLWNQGGVESKTHFSFDVSTKRLSAGADIAVAYILCTRPSSSPIPNQQFLAHFEFTGTLDFLNITDGDKIFIEIKENLIKDPTLIEDLDVETNYAQGLGIGEIKMAKNYPGHNNYLKLYEWNWGKLVDHRKEISIPALDSVSQRTTTLESKVATQEEKVGKLEEAGAPGYLSIKWYSKEDIALWDMVVVDNPNVGELSATIMLSVGDIEENQELHIQRIGSWQQLSSIKIPLQKVGNPSDGLLIQVMKSKDVAISWKKHRMGTGVAIATATVRAGDIPSTMTVKDIIFPAVKLELGEKYSVVIKRSGNVINNQNFYKIWCLDKRCSSSFELVFWGATPKIKSEFTPAVYVKSSAFFGRMFNKNTPKDVVIKTYNVDAYFSWGYHAQKTYNFTAEADIKQMTWSVAYHHNRDASITITQNGKTLYNKTIPTWSGTYTETFEIDIKSWTFQVIYYAYNSSTLKRGEKLLKWNGVPYTAGQTATIWEQIEAIIYWEFLDRLIGEQIDTTISSSATTWWIPPANAVGYMSILWPDGKKYKIRVYGE